jgi:methylglyoxal reductase
MTSLHVADASRPTIPTRQLGATGITVPAIGIGCWAIGGPDDNLGMPMGWSTGADEKQSLAGLETAWQYGARLYDTADVYGHGKSERILGRLVAQVPRHEIVLASKVGYFAGTAEHGFEPRHMRRQLEQSLDNLQTDHLNIYAFHHPNFGTDDRWLQPAIDAMRTFRDQGLIKAIGMRGPHRFALDRLTTPPDQRGDKIARFRSLFDKVEPDILAVRDNLLTPSDRSEGIFSFTDQHDVRSAQCRSPHQQTTRTRVTYRDIPHRHPTHVRNRRPQTPQTLVPTRRDRNHQLRTEPPANDSRSTY